jgi:hypothetical protein
MARAQVAGSFDGKGGEVLPKEYAEARTLEGLMSPEQAQHGFKLTHLVLDKNKGGGARATPPFVGVLCGVFCATCSVRGLHW